MNYVIMAGGTGTRLWPLSRNSRPKQFAPIISDLTMLEETMKRIKIEPNYKNVFIAVSGPLAHIIPEILPDFPKEHLIVDPEKRDTGPVVALIAAVLAEKGADEPMALINSDHYIRDTKLFSRSLETAESIIRETGKMVNIGIVPTFPNVNLGYLKIGEALKDEEGIHFYKFEGFVEKPKLELAKSYIKSGQYLWNAAYFMWTPKSFLDAFKKHAPEIGNKIEEVAALRNDQEKFLAAYRELPSISVDYAVMEKLDPDTMIIIKGDFGWSDIGSWEQLYEQLNDETDADGNLVRGEWQGINTNTCFIYGKPNKLITTIGLTDMVIVDTDDALLVCPKSLAQDVKKIVSNLKEKDLTQYL